MPNILVEKKGLIGERFDFFGLDLVVDSISFNTLYDNVIIEASRKNHIDNLHARYESANPFGIKRVIFNGPATIVFWNDGTKTVVKCADGEIYNKRTAIMWAIMKKAYGNSSKVNKAFDELIEGDEVASDNVNDDFSANPSLSSAVKNFVNSMYGVKASQK